MAQGRSVGKIALVPPRELRLDGTWLITGGLGAIGGEVARWLASRGIKRLVLTGRRGGETPGAAELVMGKANRIPATLVRGYSVPEGDGAARDLVMPPERDLFP
jgi:NAD(P)-dependent dehydrogenase (short-subunit alcohol dehydrogenase family)